MPVEFDEFSRDEQPIDETPDQTAERLTTPAHRRRWLAIGTAAGVAAVVGGVAIALTSGPAAASPAALAAAASASTSNSAKPHPAGTDGRPGRPGGPAAQGFGGGFGGQPGHPALFGTVKLVSGATVDITDQQGFTRVIVTSSKTTYKGGLTAVPKVGTKIIAEGTVDANGVSLDATTISAWPTSTGTPNSDHPKGPAGVRPTGAPGGGPGGGFQGHRPTPTATPTSTTK